MIQITFKDLEKSELAKETALEQMESVVEKFPDLAPSRVSLTLSMQNSPTQAGPDLFTVKFYCRGGKYNGVVLERSSSNLYKALAELSDALLERLNRYGDKRRVKNIKKAREKLTSLKLEDLDIESESMKQVV